MRNHNVKSKSFVFFDHSNVIILNFEKSEFGKNFKTSSELGVCYSLSLD